MNKNELIDILSKKTCISKAKCALFLHELKDVIVQSCKKGEEVQIRDFGKFFSKVKNERKFLNPQTKRYYVRPAQRVITFRGHKNFVNSMK